jgi:hypothetical protein
MSDALFTDWVKRKKKDREKKEPTSISTEEWSTEPMVFPKKWKSMTEEEQKEWIQAHYMPKKKTPEPILHSKEKIQKGIIKLESGVKLNFPIKPVAVTRRNPDLVREYEGWIGGKWLITVFHDKRLSHVKYFSIANPSRSKWIAQELSSEVINDFYSILMEIRWKYGFFKGKRRKSKRKSSFSTLSLKNTSIGGENS